MVLYGPNPYENSVIAFNLGKECRAKRNGDKLTQTNVVS